MDALFGGEGDGLGIPAEGLGAVRAVREGLPVEAVEQVQQGGRLSLAEVDRLILPRKTRHSRPDLDDPHMILLETKKGVRIDAEVFVNCPYGYDIQCQVVGEDGVGYLPEPMSVLTRKDARLSHEILQDWKLRFIDSYDVELQEWIDAVKVGEVWGPTAWDGYFASVTADACVAAKRTGGVVPIEIGERPAFYARAPKARAA